MKLPKANLSLLKGGIRSLIVQHVFVYDGAGERFVRLVEDDEVEGLIEDLAGLIHEELVDKGNTLVN